MRSLLRFGNSVQSQRRLRSDCDIRRVKADIDNAASFRTEGGDQCQARYPAPAIRSKSISSACIASFEPSFIADAELAKRGSSNLCESRVQRLLTVHFFTLLYQLGLA